MGIGGDIVEDAQPVSIHAAVAVNRPVSKFGAFTSGAIVHKRDVNAVLTGAGVYDAAATADRVADVANGVAHKIACGAIQAG